MSVAGIVVICIFLVVGFGFFIAALCHGGDYSSIIFGKISVLGFAFATLSLVIMLWMLFLQSVKPKELESQCIATLKDNQHATESVSNEVITPDDYDIKVNNGKLYLISKE